MKKNKSLLIIIFIIFMLAIINSYSNPQIYIGFFQVNEKEINNNEYRIVLSAEPVGDFNLIFRENHSFLYRETERKSKEVHIGEIWDELVVGKNYYVRFENYYYPWRIIQKTKLTSLDNF
ncbi:hypothetical protein AWH56_018120 [Anaerobacillus isosaccharinicus]|uniref:Uncharacterized protein n=1 Tax=Anaerobacillus isosaccharinicus TaxID=1532552 RepID=A0A1S2M6G7_9BACI|nr:hypothetical protein [Anaerobacillus isosaccharinicus]MBA5587178.1 hypothetical protein [Anaerobacillus isosaccharinicus]QOY34626.1 hypothetical protein AWH56_018120 [Anaerobacillus isosaccharinicus]